MRRLDTGGDVLAPGNPNRPIQVIDARDLGRWIARMAELRETGTYNATGPAQQLQFGEFLSQCERQSKRPSTVHWIGEEALIDAGIEPGNELPLWNREEDEGWDTVSSKRARRHGLTNRAIEATITATLQWDRLRSFPPLKCGLTPERERELLATAKHVSGDGIEH